MKTGIERAILRGILYLATAWLVVAMLGSLTPKHGEDRMPPLDTMVERIGYGLSFMVGLAGLAATAAGRARDEP